MAAVRLHSDLEPLLPYVRGSVHQNSPKIFETYADLIIFCASYGYHLKGASYDLPINSWLSQPNPVDYDVFKNRGIVPQILLIGLASTKDHGVARDETKLIRLIESYSAIGGKALSKQSDASSIPTDFIFSLADLLVDSLKNAEVQI